MTEREEEDGKININWQRQKELVASPLQAGVEA